jgi:hypothetical protein
MHKLKIVGGAAALFLAACSVGDSPPSADLTSEASVAGIFELFQRECIEQRSLQWARKVAPQMSWLCDGDCYINEGIVSWLVPVGTRSAAKITLWHPHGHPVSLRVPPERVDCDMTVSDDLGLFLKEAAEKAAAQAGLNREARYTKSEGDEGRVWESWVWPAPVGYYSSVPQIELDLLPSMKADYSGAPVWRWVLRYEMYGN